MTDRPPPQSTVQAAGRVAEDVVAGLRTQPMLLGLIVLNIIALGVSVWFLDRLSGNASRRLDAILHACLPGYDLKPGSTLGSTPHAQQVPKASPPDGGSSAQP